jgi:hypothetical protein
MIDTFGRKLMSGDVLEFPNLRDYNPLNSAIPLPLPRYYVIEDVGRASEGFSVTWFPHLYRLKLVQKLVRVSGRLVTIQLANGKN